MKIIFYCFLCGFALYWVAEICRNMIDFGA